MLAEVADRRVRAQIAARLDSLRSDPEKLGKPLLGELSGYRSLRSPGQRFRIDYDFCKGCGLCAAECPCGAIDMVPEEA